MGLPKKPTGAFNEDDKAYKGLPDGELWNKLREGDKRALGFIYDKYFLHLFNYGMKFCRDEDLVKDCIQDLFITLWRSRGQLSASNSIKFYLYVCLKRKLIAEIPVFRRRAGKFEFVISPEDELIQRQEEKEKYDQLVRMINKLPGRQKQVLFLRYYEGLSSRETADIMSLSVNSVYVLLSKALDFLRRSRAKLLPAIFLLQLLELF